MIKIVILVIWFLLKKKNTKYDKKKGILSLNTIFAVIIIEIHKSNFLVKIL